MADRFDSYAALAAALTEGADFDVLAEDRGSPVALLAPHGGTIEPMTGDLARQIAGDAHSVYVFAALHPGAHGDLHITSHRFDEPRALALVNGAETSIALHGRRDDGSDSTWIGGLDRPFGDRIAATLAKAGFEAGRNPRLPGEHPRNICNRTRRGAGVQLELPRRFRTALQRDEGLRNTYCAAIWAAISATYPA